MRKSMGIQYKKSESVLASNCPSITSFRQQGCEWYGLRRADQYKLSFCLISTVRLDFMSMNNIYGFKCIVYCIKWYYLLQKIGVSGLGRQIARQQQQQKQVTGSSRSLPSSWADSMEQETAAKSSTAVASDGNMESEPAEDHDDDIIEVSYQIFYFLTQKTQLCMQQKCTSLLDVTMIR